MNSQLPSELRYTASHEWLRVEDGNQVVVGITAYAQSALGDMIFVELPRPGIVVTVGDDCAVVESVKAAADIFAPVGGEVLAINEELEARPEQINEDPYGSGWLFRMQLQDPAELDALMDAEAYQGLLRRNEAPL